MDGYAAKFRRQYRGPLGSLLLDLARKREEVEAMEREQKLLRLCAGLPFILTGSARCAARYRLASHSMRLYQYDRAAAEYSALLSDGAIGFLRAWAHLLLSDCLEGLGDMAAAKVERQESRRLAKESSLALAAHLEREGRHDEAYEAIGRSLAAVSKIPTLKMVRTREALLVKISQAALRAGRLDDAMRFSEESIGTSENKIRRSLGHLTAGSVLARRGDHEEAARHRREAHILANEVGNQFLIARCLSARAMDHLAKGEINEAIDCAGLAARTSPNARREALRVQARCSLARGQGDDATSSLQQALDSPPHAIPWRERRQRADLYLMLARVEISHGGVERAEAWLQQAGMALTGEESLGKMGERIAAAITAVRHEDASGPKLEVSESATEYDESGEAGSELLPPG